MKDLIELIKAIVPLAWPLILVVLLWKLFPTLRDIVKSRSFTIKVAGSEISVQDATEQLKSQIADLQNQVITLRESRAVNNVKTQVEPRTPKGEKPTILWVDDKPNANAFEIDRLIKNNVEVIQSTSTEEAMTLLHNMQHINAVISDMGRRERGTYVSQAGIVLLNAMRRAGFRIPFIIYSAPKYVAQNKNKVLSAGGDGATASQVELLEWLTEKTGLILNEA
jgi:vacuolar-type H+-ATPase subunit F/Vma7